ncbi:MAG: protoporphyrinogen/coproporphyrinogen oxidase [Ilumatobacter sp.]|uniref:protoporphyrinogen/coproporphyrinogen oxidase n=1 Tax=Ilumatobacter sp. TaxID=1967498 RepID=UPI00391A22FF
MSVAVIGAGATGAAAALYAGRTDTGPVSLYEAADRVGGKLLDTPFAGLDTVEAGADAFLARVPDAMTLASDVGLGDDLVHPESIGAAVWHDGLHDIPAGLVLGVPGNPFALARTGLLSWRGKARAALEPLLPRTSTESDSIGEFIRRRFGDEVHERLVDSLVGSIYATDTDRFSLAEMPQLASLTTGRSVLLAARSLPRPSTSTPIFAAPAGGISRLTSAAVGAFRAEGGDVHTGAAATVEADGSRWRVNGDPTDAVVFATPAAAISAAIELDDALATAFDRLETADVVMVTLHVDANEWPERLHGRSGYLVPKPVQRSVTAASFASQKWRHWAPPAGGQILRVSLGRDGAPVMHLDDDEIVERTLADLRHHLGVSFTPIEVRITRWPAAFAQYRPHHRAWVDSVRSMLPAGIFVAGASFDGMGVPACVRSGRTNGERAAEFVRSLPS